MPNLHSLLAVTVYEAYYYGKYKKKLHTLSIYIDPSRTNCLPGQLMKHITFSFAKECGAEVSSASQISMGCRWSTAGIDRSP